MDTMGTSDKKHDKSIWSSLFTLSTMLSSVQIYNVKESIDLESLENLELFTSFGKLSQNPAENSEGETDQSNKPFQELMFLVRDWPYENEVPYGIDVELKTIYKLDEDVSENAQQSVENIKSCFEELQCFLLPIPSERIKEGKLNNPLESIDEINTEKKFKNHVSDFVAYLFYEDNLKPKLVHGQTLKCGKFGEMLIDCFHSISNQTLNSQSLLQITSRGHYQQLLNTVFEEYKRNMGAIMNLSDYVSPLELQIGHDNAVSDATLKFKHSNVIAGNREAEHEYYRKLGKMLDDEYQSTMKENNQHYEVLKSQVQKKMIGIRDDFDDKMRTDISNSNPFDDTFGDIYEKNRKDATKRFEALSTRKDLEYYEVFSDDLNCHIRNQIIKYCNRYDQRKKDETKRRIERAINEYADLLKNKCNGKNYVENLRQLHESCRCEILQRPYISQVKELKNKTEKALEQKYENFVKSNTEYKEKVIQVIKQFKRDALKTYKDKINCSVYRNIWNSDNSLMEIHNKVKTELYSKINKIENIKEDSVKLLKQELDTEMQKVFSETRRQNQLIKENVENQIISFAETAVKKYMNLMKQKLSYSNTRRNLESSHATCERIAIDEFKGQISSIPTHVKVDYVVELLRKDIRQNKETNRKQVRDTFRILTTDLQLKRSNLQGLLGES